GSPSGSSSGPDRSAQLRPPRELRVILVPGRTPRCYAPPMGKGRLEAFSDGVIAVAITIMVLELKTPHEESLHALRAQLPTLISYLLSFIYIGIYWTNHHHLF